MNPHDLADLLFYEGFGVDYDTGEITVNYDTSCDALIILAALGKLEVKRNVDGDLTYYIPHLGISDMQSYCQEFPDDVLCKMYDV